MQDQKPTRKDIRLTGFDYSNPYSYFITICTAGRRRLFWKNDRDFILSALGETVERHINEIPLHYDLIYVDKYVIMPDHVHLLLTVNGNLPWEDKQQPNISTVIQQFKRAVTKSAGAEVWQSRFYDHVCRNDKDYSSVWDYIEFNPYKYTNPEAYEAVLKKNGVPL